MGNIFERLGLQIGNRRNRKRIPFSALQWSKSTNVEKYEKKGAQKSLISSSWKKNVYNPKVERLEIGEKPEQISPKTTEKRKRDIKVSLCL